MYVPEVHDHMSCLGLFAKIDLRIVHHSKPVRQARDVAVHLACGILTSFVGFTCHAYVMCSQLLLLDVVVRARRSHACVGVAD